MINLALIPARGGSKRIKGKNIKLFHGKPIIAWTIEMAKKCNIFDKIVVSTDSEEIEAVSRKFGAEVPFLRPKEFADDETSVIEVMKHALRFYEKKKIPVVNAALLYPTSPFTREKDIKAAFRIITENDFVASVSEFPYPIDRALRIEYSSNNLTMIDKRNFFKRSQDLENFYHDAAQFIVGKKSAWLDKVPFLNSVTAPIFIPRWRMQDIDFEADWIEAELKFSILKKL